MSRIWIRLLVAAALGFVCGVSSAQQASGQQASGYPDKPIRLIVPFAPGGGNDTIARTVGDKLSPLLGQQIVVENRAGAGGTIGAELAAKSAPDGYTLFLGGVGSLAINPSMRKNLKYDPIKDFAPITLLAKSPLVLVVHPKLHVHTVQELIALAKQKPGKINYASNGNGSSSQLAALLFASMAGVNMVHIPYKGLSPALTGLIGGEVPMMFSSVVAILPHIQSGRLIALGVSGTKRLAALPKVPTIAETGLTGYEANSWYGILAPAGTPRAIVLKLNAAIDKVLQMPDVRKRLDSEGAEIVGGSPEQFADYIKQQKQEMGEIVSKAGLSLN
ncbi:tripartite tricarboxylate transporter substrate binding protein [Candidimonas humi]|uniref:Bug family tripartite tricarboxylate transporter substrate binding protein n=1 Tax=Candidimonas humi TaxID=683355 RepID=A0ABV8P2Z7_9BURK|nr:tripartite tricarboxylate transporter substrate binding protein [Candidimonas humi]MBV6306633.1 tripartite tricarboxylate transporter substrate binding protein [Candidimonas humi]